MGAEEAVGDLQSNGEGESGGRVYLGGFPEARSKYGEGVREAGNAQHGLERFVGHRATASPAKKELYKENPSALPDRDSPSFLRDKEIWSSGRAEAHCFSSTVLALEGGSKTLTVVGSEQLIDL